MHASTEEAIQPGLEDDVKSFSCLSCRQRKIKCDRLTPCSNCTKAERECSFIPPVRGKRKRTARPREGLHAKLKRYEELLRSYGVHLEPSEHGNDSDSDSEMASQPSLDVTEKARHQNRDQFDFAGPDKAQATLITEEGGSRYLDGSLWSSLEPGFQHPEIDGVHESMNRLNVKDSDIVSGSAEQHGLLLEEAPIFKNLADLHPPIETLPKFREVYVDRVDPFMKVLHLPTFWSLLMELLDDPQKASKSVDAMVFSFYLVTVSSMGDDECLNVIGTQKTVLHSRYCHAARQALIDAKILSTSNMMTLQAYSMFMMGVRSTYSRDTLFSLSGIAIRLARKMGLQRDGSSLGFSPFETELRRRLWWHLVHMDFRLAELVSSKPSMDLVSSDTKMPLNVFDEDLFPTMIDSPPERSGITSVVICLFRCELVEFLRQMSLRAKSDARWEVLSGSAITMETKESMIREMEDLFERKYLRYCDPSNPLHNLMSILMRSVVCKMKLYAHDPRRRLDNGIQVSQAERDMVFTNASKLLEYNSLVSNNSSLEKYTWQMSIGYLRNTILYVLIEARHRKTGPEVDRMWYLIGLVLHQYPQVLGAPGGPVYTAFRKWILEVWNDYTQARQSIRLPDPSVPEYVAMLRQPQYNLTKVVSWEEKGEQQVDTVRDATSCSDLEIPSQKGKSILDFETFGAYDFSDILSFETDATEWLQWENLVAEERGIPAIP